LASSTEKRRRKKSSLGVFINLIIFISVGIVVRSPQVFHNWRRKRWVDDWLGGLKTHRSAHLALALLKSRKPLAHLLMRLTNESIVGAAHGNESLEARDEDVLLLPQHIAT
jgi:thiosulfate reductase cytochrome b subunit